MFLLIIITSLRDIIRRSPKICCTMLAVFMAPMTLASVLTADYSVLPFTFLFYVICLLSLYCHETAHLVVLRVITGDSRQGVIEASWTQLWVSAPATLTTLTSVGHLLVALSGPLIGTVVSILPVTTGVAALPCVLLAGIHLSNMLPFFPDGKIVAISLLTLFLKNRLKNKPE